MSRSACWKRGGAPPPERFGWCDRRREPRIRHLTHRAASEIFDAVLLLGPLYHLLQPEERCAAVAEAARILKPGGCLLAAGINRIAYVRALFDENPEAAV